VTGILLALGLFRYSEITPDVIEEIAEELHMQKVVQEAVAEARRQRKKREEEYKLRLEKAIELLAEREGREVIIDRAFRIIGMSDGTIVCKSNREESLEWWNEVLEKTRKEVFGGGSSEQKD
jgi:hypothetical protein